MIIFLALKKNKLRINKFVALHFPTSRRKADQLIAEGKVLVNNNIAQLGVEVNPSDKIYVDGKLLNTILFTSIIFLINQKVIYALIKNKVMERLYLS